METWPELIARHERERRDLIAAMAARRITQAQAAPKLNVTRTYLNQLIRRHRVFWPVKKQGQRT